MAHFAKIQTTQQGKNIILAGQNKQSVVFTKVELGDGLLDEGQSVDDMTALVHSVMSLPLQNFVNNGDGTARLRFVLDNNNLSKGFFNREIGVFAKVGDGTEQLFAYTNAGNLADYIPGKESPISSKIINLHIIVGNAANLTIVAENSAYVTKLDMDGHKTQEVLDHPDGSVTTPKIRDEAVTGTKIAQASIEKKHLKKGGISAEDVGAYSRGETDGKITAHRTAAELDHPEKSVQKKHLSFEAYDKAEVDSRVNTKVSKSGDTMTGALEFANNVKTALNGTMGTNTKWRIYNSNTVGGRGHLCFDISDNCEGVYARIFSNNFGTELYYAELLGHNGRTTFPISVTAPRFYASNGFEGTATNANKLQNWSLQNILDEFLNVWHANKTYAVGDIAYHKALPSWARLECVVAGTTGSNASVFSTNAKAGQYIQDGGVKWIVDDVRDCNRVGSIVGSLYLPDGYIKANGATVNRADYPRLVALADRYGLWTDNAAANAGMFGRGNGSSTFVLPNWIDRMTQFAETAGLSVQAGLPNIHIKDAGLCAFGFGYKKGKKNGVIFTGEVGEDVVLGTGRSKQNAEIDVSTLVPIYGRSSTVQPAAIRLIPIIKY